VHEPKKAFYKKFLYEPFPVESSLADSLCDHLNAEVAAGTLRSAQDGVDYLTWTYLFRRIMCNPTYYGLPSAEPADVDAFLSTLVRDALRPLQVAGCITMCEEGDEGEGEEEALLFGDDDAAPPPTGWDAASGGARRARGGAGGGVRVRATPLGRIASQYYLSHRSAATLAAAAALRGAAASPPALLRAVAACAEFDELPVRHNEDKANVELAAAVSAAGGWPTDVRAAEDPHTKAHLLLQCHMLRVVPPISDYITDLKGVLDNAARLLPAAVDAAAHAGGAAAARAAMRLCQCVAQARHPGGARGDAELLSLTALPRVSVDAAARLRGAGVRDLRDLATRAQADGGGGGGSAAATAALRSAGLSEAHTREAVAVAARLPLIALAAQLGGAAAGKGDATLAFAHDEAPITIAVQITRTGRAAAQRGAGPPRAYAPGMVRLKSEGWWLLAEDARSGALHALKRLTLRNGGGGGSAAATTAASLQVPRAAAAAPGAALVLRLVSDCYLGLDAELALFTPPPLAEASDAAGGADGGADVYADGGDAEEEQYFEACEDEDAAAAEAEWAARNAGGDGGGGWGDDGERCAAEAAEGDDC
jgi:activating signal cointegrator complex subunit 3